MIIQNSTSDEVKSDNESKTKVPRRLKTGSSVWSGSWTRAHFQSELTEVPLKMQRKGMVVLMQSALLAVNGCSDVGNISVLLNQVLRRGWELQQFVDYQGLLRYKYEKGKNYCIIIREQLVLECQKFVENEIRTGDLSLFLVCLQKGSASSQQIVRKGQKESCVFYVNQNVEKCSLEIVEFIRQKSQKTAKKQKISESVFANNFIEPENQQSNQIHFICEEIIAKMMHSYRAKTKAENVIIDQFKSCEEVMALVGQTPQKCPEMRESNYYVVAKDAGDLFSQHEKSINSESTSIYFPQSKSIFNTSRHRNSRLKKQLKPMKKIIICRRFHSQIKKIRALVGEMKRKLVLWQISDESSGLLTKLREYFGEENENNDNLELQSYKSQHFKEQKEEKIALVEPIPLNYSIDCIDKTLNKISVFSSTFLPCSEVELTFFPEFCKQQSAIEQILIPIAYLHSTIDIKVPSLMSSMPVNEQKSEPSPLGLQILNKIKQNAKKNIVLKPNLDQCAPVLPSLFVFADDFSAFRPIQFQFLPQKLKHESNMKNEETKYLFYSSDNVEDAFGPNYSDYAKIQYKGWEELQSFLFMTFRGKSNWLLKPLKNSLAPVSLQTAVYLQKSLCMKEFKHFSEQSSKEKEPFWDLPEVYYQSELGLSSKLQAEESPGVIIYNQANEKWVSNLRVKYGAKFKWFCLEDQSWINQEGKLSFQTNVVKLSKKIAFFVSMFDNHAMDACQGIQFFRLAGDWLAYERVFQKEKLIEMKSEQELKDYYVKHEKKMIVVFVEALKESCALLQAQKESKGRLKLIYVKSRYVDSDEKFFIKHFEISGVIKNITKMLSEGRKDVIIFHQSKSDEVNKLIEEKHLERVMKKVYVTIWPDVESIFSSTKGLYRKVYAICYSDQKKDIERLFCNYHIRCSEHAEQKLEFFLHQRQCCKESPLKQTDESESLDQPSSEANKGNQNELAIQSGKQSSLKLTEMISDGEKGESEGRSSLPIQSRDHEEAPPKELEKMVRVDDFERICIVYQQHMDPQQKRGLLAACTKNQKIIPVLYNSVSELKQLRSENALMLLLMKEIPMELFNQLIQKQQLAILFKHCNLKAVLPKYTDINLNSITDCLQNYNTVSIRKLESEQVTHYLSKFQSQVFQNSQNLKSKQEYGLSSGTSSKQQCEGPTSNLSKQTSTASTIRQLRLYREEFDRLKKALNKNLLVLLVDFNKRNKFMVLAVKHHLMLQSYSGEANMETEIRKKIGRHVVMCIVGKQLLPKAVALKKRYSNVFFFLQYSKYTGQIDPDLRECLSGQFGKTLEFEKFMGQLKIEGSKVESNPQEKIGSDSGIKSIEEEINRNNFHYYPLADSQTKKLKSIEPKKSPLTSQGEQAGESSRGLKLKNKCKSPIPRRSAAVSMSEYYQ